MGFITTAAVIAAGVLLAGYVARKTGIA